ncbi:MAG: hypothetical protein ABSH35_36730 [Isosphaeraceae bacterium]|jgi:hypothetical protein
MFLCKGNIVYDPDLDILAGVLEVIDRQLATVRDGCDDPELADQFGFFDRAEHIIGLGFVACQAYLTATYGFLNIDKPEALTVGPVHPTGQRIVRIVNDAANFWKHHAEWHRDTSPAKHKQIQDTFTAVGFPVALDYPLSGILSVFVGPGGAAFKPLVAKLAAWRDDLRAMAT